MIMIGWVKSFYRKIRAGVVFPETYYIMPVLLKLPKTGQEIILKEDGSIQGDFEVFDKFCRDHIVTEYAEARITVWLLREHWKRLREEDDAADHAAQTAITQPSSPPTLLVEEEKSELSFDGEKKMKMMKVTVQTIDGPKEFEYNVEDSSEQSRVNK